MVAFCDRLIRVGLHVGVQGGRHIVALCQVKPLDFLNRILRCACWACLVDAKAMHGNGVVSGGLVQESGVVGIGRSKGHSIGSSVIVLVFAQIVVSSEGDGKGSMSGSMLWSRWTGVVQG